MAEQIAIEVAYATPDKQKIIALSVSAGTDIQTAITESGISELFPEIDVKASKVGIFSRPAKLSDQVRELDRIEIYRPLIADPKEMRKLRAERAKEEGRANKVTGGRIKK